MSLSSLSQIALVISRTTLHRFVLGVFVIVLSSTISSAITYNVNRSIDDGGVTGFIQTDGTLGVLAHANILDWDLLLDNGTSTFSLLGPLSGNNSQLLLTGFSYIASAFDISFDFSNTQNDIVLFQNPSIGSSVNFWCLDGSNDGCAGTPNSESVALNFNFQEIAPRSGVVVVASVIPEPSSLLLVACVTVPLALRRRAL